MNGFLFLTRSNSTKFHNTVTVLALLVWFNVFFYLNPLVKLAYVQKLRVFRVQVLQHITPLQTCESWLAFRLVCKNHPTFGVFAML